MDDPDKVSEEPAADDPVTEGETLLEIGGETLLEIGHPSIYNDPGLQQRLAGGPGSESTTRDGERPPSNATTRLVSSIPAGAVGGARYQIVGEIGRGGMGVVLRAIDRDLRRTVALKVARADRHTSQQAARFIEEAQVTGQLSHPNIVPVHELGIDPGGRAFFTMKLVEGRSLADVLRELRRGDEKTREAHTLSRRLYAFEQLLNCMQYAHDRGVIHRDLKPDNIMLGDYGEVMVMDWGLARVLGEPEPGGAVQRVTTTRLQTPGSETMDGTVIGTPAYMSPEQARGERDAVDQRSDIYSLGAILYEMLALRPPFEAATASELISKVSSSRPPRPSKRNPHAIIPRGIEAMCMKCLEREPADRYQSVADLRSALDDYRREAAESVADGPFFPLLGKFVVLAGVTSLFLFSAAFIAGPDNLDVQTHLFEPGHKSALLVYGFGTLFAWLRLGVRGSFDATHAVLLWGKGGVADDELRGYFAAEACRRAKWLYLLPAVFTLIFAVVTAEKVALTMTFQMLGAGVVAVLIISVFEQGAYRKLGALDAITGQDRRDMLWRWLLVLAVFGIGLMYMRAAAWDFQLGKLPADFRRGTLVAHILVVLAGLWVLAQIGHPHREVNRSLGRLLWPRRLSDAERERLAPMARAYASNAVTFGAMGSLTWLGLLGPNAERLTGSYFLMALTPIWAGILLSWWFRLRAGKLISAKSDELRRRFDDYLKQPRPPRRGMAIYLAFWTPIILGGLGTALWLIGKAASG